MFIPNLFLVKLLALVKEAKTEQDLKDIMEQWMTCPNRTAMSNNQNRIFKFQWREKFNEIDPPEEFQGYNYVDDNGNNCHTWDYEQSIGE